MKPTPAFRRPLTTVLIAAAMLGAGTGLRADDAEKVEAFLARLGLTEYQVLHLEQQLQQEHPKPQQVKLGRHLADLYAERLLDTSDDPETYADVLRRINALVAKIPEANTSSLAVMLLNADYSRAERQVARWMADPRLTDNRDEARKILEDIVPKLKNSHTELRATAERLGEELDAIDDGPAFDAKEQELRRVEVLAARAAYLTGWSCYQLGLITSNDATLNQGRNAFRQLLDIDEETPYDDIDADWLGLESVYRSKAVMGLGLTEAALGNVTASRTCFKLLDDASVPLEIRDEAPYSFVQGLISAGLLQQAKQYAEEQTKAFRGDATQGKVNFCAALVRAGFADPESSPEAKQLGKLGIVGLVKIGALQAALQLMEEYQIPLDADAGFHMKWLKGRQLFSQAQQSKDTTDYQAAAAQLSAALEDPEAKADAGTAGQVRALLAWSHFLTKDFRAAGREFERAVPGLKVWDREAAVKAIWMAFESYRALSKEVPSAVNSAIRMLEQLIRDFPDHEFAKKAKYQIGALKKDSESPEESLRRLNQIPPGDPTYLPARYDICTIRRRMWWEANAGQRPEMAGQLRDAVETYLKAAGTGGDAARKLKGLVMVVESAQAAKPPDHETVATYLDRARPLAESLPASTSAVAEYYYYRLQLARHQSDTAAAQKYADWLITNAAGSQYEVSALILHAKTLDDAAKSAEAENLPAINRKAYEIYGRLVKHLGSSADLFSSNKNARVATYRLAHYALEVGDYAQAAVLLERLLKYRPDDTDYVQRAMKAQFGAGNLDRCLEHSRRIREGVTAGSDDWYEAKYYQLQCLLGLDRDEAGRVWEDFELLYPELGGDKWRDEFKRLRDEIRR